MYKSDDLYNIYGCVTTQHNLKDKGQAVVEFIENFMHQIAEKLNKNNVCIELESDKSKHCIKDFNKNWDKAKEKICSGRLKALSIFNFDEELANNNYKMRMDDYEGLLRDEYNWGLGMKIYYPGCENGFIEFHVEKLEYEHGIIPQYVEKFFVNSIKDLTIKLGGVAGIVTIDEMGLGMSESPHEAWLAFNPCEDDKYIENFYRGYFWGNFINANHVTLLGGIDEIKKCAPVFLAEGMENGGAYLQLTEDINSFSDDDLRKLKAYFAPILMKSHPNQKSYKIQKIKGRFIAGGHDKHNTQN